MSARTRTVQHTQLTPGNIIFVRGQVGFSRISRHTTDAEREKDNMRRTHKIERNYTTISIYNAQVLAQNPQAPTLEEIYASESCYNASNAEDYPGFNFTAMNKSSHIPKVGVLSKNSSPDNNPSYDEIILEGELQKGTDVTLILRVFAGQGNNGVSLDTVLINQSDFQYYGNNSNVQEALNTYGITFNAMSPNEKAAQSASAAQNAAPTAPQMNQQAAPMQPQAPQDTANPFGAAAVNQPQFQQAAPMQPQGTPFGMGGQPTIPPAQNGQGIQFGVGPNRTY